MDGSDAAPLLVVWDSQTPNRFAGYLTEILQVEGYSWFAVHDLAQAPLTADSLAGHQIVLTTHVALSEATQEVLLAYVRHGGNLVTSRPPESFAATLGLVPYHRDIADRYLSFHRLCALNAGVDLPSLQFHGRGELYTWPGDPAHVLAHFEGVKGVRTAYPAITIGTLGAGQWAVFAYDLAESTLLFHQGRREQASTGAYPDADGDRMYKPTDLFVGFLDPELTQVPQADVHQDALVRVLDWMASLGRPLPRLWHFPNGARAAAFFNGDGDNMSARDLAASIDRCERYGVPFTTYLMLQDHEKVTPGWEAALRGRGHDFGEHAWAGPMPTLEEMRTQLRRELGAFRERYGHVGVTYRGHSVIWVGWTEMAQYLRENGVHLDTDFSAGRYFRGGYGNGSGLPVKFMDEDGRLLDIYEQCTLSTDDGWTTDKLFYPAMSIDECIALSTRQLDEAVQRYHTVYHPYFHPLATRPGPRSAERWQETMLARGRERGLHFVSGANWVDFNDGRRGVRLAAYRFDPDALALELELEAELRVNGLTLALPAVFRGAGLVQATVDGEPVPAEPQPLEGRRQVLLPADYAPGQRRRWRVAWGHGGA